MQYTEVNTPNRLYYVDEELIDRIISDAAYFESKYSNRQTITTDDGIGLPETHHLEIDYSRAKKDAKDAVTLHHTFRKLLTAARESLERRSVAMSREEVEGLRSWLFERESAGRTAKNKLLAEQKNLSKTSMSNIRDAVGRWQAATTVARIIRDASADVLLLTAGVVSGGTALALAGAGSVMKGVGKWEDSGSLGAGVLQTSVSFLTALIPGGASVKQYGAGAATFVVFAKAKTEFAGNFAVALAEGKEVGEAAVSAGVDTAIGTLASGIAGAFFPESSVQELLGLGLKNAPVPVGVAMKIIGAGTMSGAIGGEATGDAVSQVILDTIKKQKGQSAQQVLSRTVAISDPVLVDMAIVGPDRSTAARNW